MTVQEAIKNVTAYVYMECENMPQQVIKALDVLKDSANECEQYRALGTVKELKEAREKQVAKKPTFVNEVHEGAFYRLDFECPSCNHAVVGQPYKPNYCKHCGQALKWGEEDD